MNLATRRINTLALLSLAGIAAASGSALAQSTWLNPVSGNWNDPSKWSAGVPNGIAAIVNQSGTYTITFNGYFSIPSLTQSVPGVTIFVPDNITYSMTGPISNAGVIRINDGTGVSATYLRLTNGGQTISGTGSIRLSSSGNVNTAQLTTNSGSWPLTNDTGHSIRGDGAIYVPVINNGLIVADVAGRTLLVNNGGTTNSGQMRADTNAVLHISGVTIGGSGNILANGGTINLASSGISDQTMNTAAGGVISIQNTTYNGVTTNGTSVIPDNNTLNISNNGIVNNGTIEINNGSGGNATYFRVVNGSTSLTGSGIVRLRSSGNLDTAQITTNSGSWTLTHGANHQIRGDGRIYTPIANLGSIIADTTGRNLEILNSTSSNSGLISAENGATVRIGSTAMNQSGGIIRAITNGGVILDNSTINGGSVTSTGAAATIIRNSTLSQVVLTGQSQVPDNFTLNIPGTGITNNGNIIIQDGGSNASYLRVVNGDTTVSGTGTITLNATANLDTAQITTNSNSWTYTSTAGQTIRGTGRIYSTLTNDGTIVADRAGVALEWRSSNSTNNNLVTTNGGVLNLVALGLTQGTNGRIIAANGDITINGSTIAGGTITGAGSPVYIVNSTMNAPTLTGDIRIPNNAALNLPGTGMVNNGTIRVSDNAGGNGTYIRQINGDTTISGSGTIVLDSNGNLDTAQLTTNSNSWTMTIGSSQTVRGDGRIYATIANNGTIIADQASAALEWRSSPSSNNSIARTQNGSTLRLASLSLTQTANGQLLASDGSVDIVDSTITGGVINGQNSPVLVRNSTFASLTTLGDVRIPNNNALNVPAAGFTNNGTIRVSDGEGGNGTYLRVINGSFTIDGSGSIILNANSNPQTAQLTTNSGSWTMNIGQNQSLRGTGAINTPVNIIGTLSPGEPEFFTGRFTVNGSPLTIASTGRAVFDILSPTDYDRVTGFGNCNIQGGTLTIRFPGGFVGALGQTYTLLSGSSVSNTFTTIQLPAHPTQGLKYGIEYRPNAVLLRVTCLIDFNSDGVIDLFDYLDFVQVFQGGQLDADYNGDGVVDLFDYLDFVAEFATGCN
jgi:hypothetical protein